MSTSSLASSMDALDALPPHDADDPSTRRMSLSSKSSSSLTDAHDSLPEESHDIVDPPKPIMSVPLMPTSSPKILYDSLPKASIRVLKLEGTCLAGDENEKFRDLAIQCSLHTISLHEARGKKTPYAAISYVWGSTQLRRPLVCNGHTMLVTQNLHNALWRLAFVRPRPPLELLWVDAVCINQDDQDEKTAQVNLMGQIYGMASVVLVWLGSVAEVAGGPFERFWHYTQKGDRMGLENDHEAREKGLEFLTTSDWFKRVWTLQEIVLAKDSLVYCGNFRASWMNLVNMATILGTRNKQTDLKKVHELKQIVGTQTKRKGQNKSRLSDIVQYTAARQATQLHDRIFGLRGLYAGNWAIDATYQDSATKVLAQATTMMLREQGNLKFIKLLKLRQVYIIPPDNDEEMEHDQRETVLEDRSVSNDRLSTFRRKLKGNHKSKDPSPVTHVFRPRMKASSWVPTWTAQSRKVADTITDILDFGKKQNQSILLERMYRTSKMQVELHDTTLSARGIVLGRLNPIRPVAVGEYFWEGQIQFSTFPNCVRKLMRLRFAGKGISNVLHMNSHEIYAACASHDQWHCDCQKKRSNRARQHKTTASSSMAWVCLLYGAPDFTILEPHYDELANRVTFTLLLATARKNTDQIARVLLSSKSTKGSEHSDVHSMLDCEFTSVPTSFDILGELPEESTSRFWAACPDRLPTWGELGVIFNKKPERYANLVGASKYQLVHVEDWPTYQADRSLHS